MKQQKASAKMSKYRHLSKPVRLDTRQFILRNLLLLLSNPPSLKYLTAAQGQTQLWHLKCPIECESDSCSRTIAAGIAGTHSRNGGFTFCDEVRLCLQVLSCF